MAAMARLNRIWQSSTISPGSKFKLCKSLVTALLFYGCSTRTLLADSEKRIQAFETKCLRKPLRICYLERKTNDWVRSMVNFLVGPQEPLLATLKRRKLAWFGLVTRHDSLSKTHPSGHRERWATLRAAEEMLNGQRQRLDIPARARSADNGFLQKETGRGSLLNHLSCSPDDPIGQETLLN